MWDWCNDEQRRQLRVSWNQGFLSSCIYTKMNRHLQKINKPLNKLQAMCMININTTEKHDTFTSKITCFLTIDHRFRIVPLSWRVSVDRVSLTIETRAAFSIFLSVAWKRTQTHLVWDSESLIYNNVKDPSTTAWRQHSYKGKLTLWQPWVIGEGAKLISSLPWHSLTHKNTETRNLKWELQMKLHWEHYWYL